MNSSIKGGTFLAPLSHLEMSTEALRKATKKNMKEREREKMGERREIFRSGQVTHIETGLGKGRRDLKGKKRDMEVTL